VKKNTQPCTVMAKEKDYQALCPLFGWLPTDTIKRTFEATTQYACIPMSTILKKHFPPPNPALNVQCWNEPVATDTVYSDIMKNLYFIVLSLITGLNKEDPHCFGN